MQSGFLIKRRDGWVLALLLFAAPPAAQFPSRLELAVLEETNRARTNPAADADYLEPMLSWFPGDVMSGREDLRSLPARAARG